MSEEMLPYRVACGGDIRELELNVAKLYKMGYRPCGPLVDVEEDDDDSWVQPMQLVQFFLEVTPSLENAEIDAESVRAVLQGLKVYQTETGLPVRPVYANPDKKPFDGNTEWVKKDEAGGSVGRTHCGGHVPNSQEKADG